MWPVQPGARKRSHFYFPACGPRGEELVRKLTGLAETTTQVVPGARLGPPAHPGL